MVLLRRMYFYHLMILTGTRPAVLQSYAVRQSNY